MGGYNLILKDKYTTLLFHIIVNTAGMHKLHSLDCGWYIKHSGQIIFFYTSKQILLTEPSENIAFCISQSLSLLQGDHFG